MSGYTVCCALCCATILNKHRDRDVGHGRDSGRDIDRAWMGEFMIIARDPETQETFIIEKARHHRDNTFDVHNDEQVANHGEAFDSRLVTVYHCEGPQEFAAPFHVDCYKVLADAYEPRDIDLSALYDTLESYCLRDDSIIRCQLQFDYNKPRHNVVGTAHDFSYASPNRVSDLTIFVDELKINSRRSRSNVPHILNGERLTPTKIYNDMPWAKYIFSVKQHKMTIDMAIYYKNLVALGNGRLREGNFSLPLRMHLQNRCRLWGVCSRLLEECSALGQSANRTKTKTKTKTKKQEPLIKHTKKAGNILRGAISSPIPLLTFPAYASTVYDRVSLIEEMKDLEKAEPVIRVYWDANKHLAGIGVYDPNTDTFKTLGPKDLFHKSQDAQIPQDNWLAGIFIVTKEVPQEIPRVWRRVIVGIKFMFLYDDFVSFGEPLGDIRVLVPKPWHTVVGIGASWNEARGVESLVLLQQDQEKVPQSAHCRVGMEYPDDLDGLSVLTMFRPDPRIANFLWRGWIPLQPEIWPTYPVRLDPLMPTPVETLMLTKPLNDNLGYKFILGVDAQFRAFEVLFEYKDKTVRRSIGLPTAMHYFFMDSDEQITKCYITGKDKVEAIRFVTDKTQHFIVGRPGREERSLAKEGLSMESIEGFHCRWSDDRNSSLSSLGVLTLEFSSVNLGEDREDKDAQNILGHYWVPKRPQTRFPIVEAGQIHGMTKWIERLRYPGVGVPSPQTVVTWLDCSKPLETIFITMCHSTTTKLLMMTSMTFMYAEGHESMSFGPIPIDSPEHDKDVKKQDRCACIHGGSFEQEIEDIPHYEPDKWHVYGGYLKTLRVWLNEMGVLTGLQLVADESESQKWGFCDGEHVAELDLRSKETRTAGIKFFLDSNGRNHVSEDTVVVAVQQIAVPKNGDKQQNIGYKKPRYG